jgi:hypothetical protein
MTRPNRTLSAWQRRRRAQRHVLLGAAYERALVVDLTKVLKRIARSAAKLVAVDQKEQAIRLPDAYRGQLTRLFEGRLEASAMASARLVLDELTGEKAAPAGIERKFLSLFKVAQAAIRTWISSYAAAKVVRILETTRLRIRRSIQRGDKLNEPPRVLARRIVKETGGEIARRRAETIARTESLTAASVGADEAARVTGLQLDKVWLATEDMRTRPTHAAASGQRVAMDATFTVGGASMRFPRDPHGPANECINCFPFDTDVEALPVAATRHWYEGDLIEIVTRGGNKLSATPNHPILTDAGWKPIHLILKGDNVISSVAPQIKVSTNPDVKNVNASIGEVFNSGLNSGEIERVGRGDVDFHGDRPSHDVDVVFIDRKLRGCSDAALIEHGDKFVFQTPNAGHSSLVSLSLPTRFNVADADLSALGIRSGDDSFSRHVVGVSHSDAHGFGSSSTVNASISETFVDRPSVGDAKVSGNRFDGLAVDEAADNIVFDSGPLLEVLQSDAVNARAGYASPLNVQVDSSDRNASFAGNLLKRFPGKIVVDEVLSVNVRKVSCHVFNLEDVDGWYIAQRIIVHNCRCVVLYEPRLPK